MPYLLFPIVSNHASWLTPHLPRATKNSILLQAHWMLNYVQLQFIRFISIYKVDAMRQTVAWLLIMTWLATIFRMQFMCVTYKDEYTHTCTYIQTQKHTNEWSESSRWACVIAIQSIHCIINKWLRHCLQRSCGRSNRARPHIYKHTYIHMTYIWSCLVSGLLCTKHFVSHKCT